MMRSAARLPVPTLCLVAALLPSAALASAPLTIDKAAIVVGDLLGLLHPRMLPGSSVDYTLTVTNPSANSLIPIRKVVLSDPIPDTVKLRVADLVAAGKGPVEFLDGNLLGLGLLGSGLAYSFAGLGNAADGIEFSDGTNWAYTPVADAQGCDAKVRGIRVTLTGTHATGTTFRLRYRVVLP